MLGHSLINLIELAISPTELFDKLPNKMFMLIPASVVLGYTGENLASGLS